MNEAYSRYESERGMKAKQGQNGEVMWGETKEQCGRKIGNDATHRRGLGYW